MAPYVIQLSTQHLLLSVGLGLQPSTLAGGVGGPAPLSARSLTGGGGGGGRGRSNSGVSLGGRSDAESSHVANTALEAASRRGPRLNLFRMLYYADSDAFKVAVSFL